ncbi:Acg family FMN-binding oxidoreductase [Streptomyces sp. NPDC048172]|uniref:Acg family FMN-binding oxidoreductase n=1 Tax=Streptomyces sp. NPDC048172 TaxID=3365505 RepID=UPI003722CA7D
MTGEVLDAETVAALVEDATAAPSMHNAQPWKFRFLPGSGTFQVRSDLDRALPKADPTTRALHLGCGAAVFNLRVAAAHAGWDPATRLLPDPEDTELLATVRLAEPVAPDGVLTRLYPAVHRRHTSRAPFTGEEIPADVRDALGEAALAEEGRLTFPDAWHVESLLELVRDAEDLDTLNPVVARETAHWVRVDDAAGAAEDGIPAHALGPRKHGGKAPVRDLAGGRAVAGRETAAFEQTPQIALLGTVYDRPLDWLLAGQAMERVLLVATLNGLSTALNSHALEWPELRWDARDPRSAMGYVQMMLRLGYGPETPATPRRPVQEVLEFE